MALSREEIRAIVETANFWHAGLPWGKVGTGF
jgi:hypothetical protein